MSFEKLVSKTKILISFLSLFALINLFPCRLASAQIQNGGNVWYPPINLSHSGSTTNPSIVVDSNGIIHVVWEDTIAGEMYTSYDGTQWSTPVAVSLPFGAAPRSGASQQTGSTNLRLISDSKGYVHAFWVEQSNQQNGPPVMQLHYSRVLGSQFANGANWDATQTLANSAVDYDVALDNQDRIHLAYVRNLDEAGFPAGIYYRQSAANGASWSNPKILYQSQYFRSLTNQNANVSVATDRNGAGQNIYIAWDNRPRKQVFFSRSTDGGNLWSDPTEIDKPDASNGFATPFNIRLAANDQGALMEWQVGDPAGSCTQNYQWSTDAGTSWGDRQPMLDQIGACPQQNQYFESNSGLILLATTVQTQIYFLAWNGSQWSDPQLQSELSGFKDPETFDQVVFNCRNLTMGSNDQIYVVGCDTGNGGDIWQTSQPIGDISSWFPSPSAWSKPVEITSGQQSTENPIALADSEGNFHVFWIQANTSATAGNQNKSIFYSRWDGRNWLNPVMIETSADGDITEVSAAIDSANIIYLSWDIQQTGVVFFSKVNADRAYNPPDWSVPAQITLANEVGVSPEILVDLSGLLSIIYAVPINESRGIYLVQSGDKGDSWSSPLQVFDGAKAGWERIGLPQITRGSDGQFHALWSKFSLADASIAQNLIYSRSIDGGRTWSEPSTAIETSLEWSDIVAVNNSEILRLWLENQNGHKVLWYQYSKDGGLNWERPEGIPSFGETLGSVKLVLSPTLQPYLLQTAQDTLGNTILHSYLWQSDNWSPSNDLTLSTERRLSTIGSSGAISSAGLLGSIYAYNLSDPINDAYHYSMDFVERSVRITGTLPSPLPTPTPEVIVTPQTVISSTLQPSPPPPLPYFMSSEDTNQSSNAWSGLIIGAGSAFVIGLIVIVLGLLNIKK